MCKTPTSAIAKPTPAITVGRLTCSRPHIAPKKSRKFRRTFFMSIRMAYRHAGDGTIGEFGNVQL